MDKKNVNNYAGVINEQVYVDYQHSNQAAQPKELASKSRKLADRKGGAKQ